ncbi:MAG: cysteine hydrolase family protein [Candidatus Woesearchaeota archaeon]
MKKKAILVIDIINEIVDEKGAMGSHGYYQFLKDNNSINNINNLINNFRKNKDYILFFIRVQFSEDYREVLNASPIFKDAPKYSILKKNTWSTDWHKDLEVHENDIVVTKNRVSPFYGTNLNLLLDNFNVSELIISGVSTHLAIESTVREAHDYGYDVTVVEDCCIACSDKVHNNSLFNIGHFAEIVKLDEILNTNQNNIL